MKYQKSRELVQKILENEIKEHGVNVEILPITQNESAFEIIKRGLKNQLESTIAIMQDIKDELYFNKSTIAYYDYLNHKLRVLLDIVQKHSYNKEQYLWLLLKTVYHEYKHAIINEAKTNEIKSLEDFYLNLENITSANEKFYLQNHDNFYEEILANKYGVEKAATLLEQKYSKTKAYKKIKPSIAIEKILQEIYYENHTIDPFLDKINNTIKETVNDVDSYNLEMEYQLISILYNTDGSFKNLKQLSQDTGWQELPNKFNS